MFINRNNIFTMDGKSISSISYKKGFLTGKLNIIDEKSLDYKDVNNKFEKNVIIIMENEEIYIKYITVPRVRRDEVERIVRDELRFYYRTDTDITFSYSILKKSKTSMELVVFYINSNSLNTIALKNIKSIKSIYLIQFCYAKYVKDISKLNNYVIAFIYKQNLYFVFCEVGLIKYNYIFRNFNESAIEFETCLNYFMNLNKDIEDNLNMIYISGFREETICSLRISYCFENLGNIEQSELFKAVI